MLIGTNQRFFFFFLLLWALKCLRFPYENRCVLIPVRSTCNFWTFNSEDKKCYQKSSRGSTSQVSNRVSGPKSCGKPGDGRTIISFLKVIHWNLTFLKLSSWASVVPSTLNVGRTLRHKIYVFVFRQVWYRVFSLTKGNPLLGGSRQTKKKRIKICEYSE